MPSPTFLRRSLLTTLVIASLAAVLSGCANVAGISDKYTTTVPIASHGRACFAWSFGQGFEGNQVDEVIPGEVAIVRIAGEPPRFDDLPGMQRLGHSIGHVMKGRHQ